ncbi:hypothetical protein ACVBEH_01405 [Roseateles sp. GG27B]
MTMADLLRNSDVAMYAAKSQGRNSAALYTPQLAGLGAKSWSWKVPCTRRWNAAKSSCTTNPKLMCAAPAWWASRR